MYDKNYINLDDSFRKYLEQILLLQSFFNDNNIKYIFFDSIENLLSPKVKKYRKRNQSLFDMVDTTKWIVDDNYYSFNSYLVNNFEKYEKGNEHKYWMPDGHPNKSGCLKWWEKVEEHIKKVEGWKEQDHWMM